MNTCEETIKEVVAKINQIPKYDQRLPGLFAGGMERSYDGTWVRIEDVRKAIKKVEAA